jgi:exodeoxyribonuclease VII small subunit
MDEKNSAPTFEESFRRAEEAVEALERGDLSLEDCLRQYESGFEALRSCYSILARAQERIEVLAASSPFGPGGNEKAASTVERQPPGGPAHTEPASAASVTCEPASAASVTREPASSGSLPWKAARTVPALRDALERIAREQRDSAQGGSGSPTN